MKDDPDDIFEIDQHSLDREWVRQSKLYMAYATKLADAREEWERAKSSRDVIRAELDHEIRKDPDKYEVAKTTNEVVENAIIRQYIYQVASDTIIKAKHKVDILQATVEALDHRKKALENLVQLWSQSYFSDPVAKGEAAREHVDMAKKKEIRNKSKIK